MLRLTPGQNADSERPWHSQFSVECLHPCPPLRAQGTLQSRNGKIIRASEDEKEIRNQCLPVTTCTYELTETIAARTGPAQIQARWIPVLTGELGMEPRFQPRSYLQVSFTCKVQVSFIQWNLTGYSKLHLRAGLMHNSRWPTKTKLNGMLELFCLIMLCLELL